LPPDARKHPLNKRTPRKAAVAAAAAAVGAVAVRNR